MTEIIREINEELQAKRYVNLAKTYGKYVVGIILLIVVSFGGYSFWQDRSNAIREQRSVDFAALASNAETLPESWTDFAKNRNDSFSLLAWRFAATQYVKQGKITEATEIMQNLANKDKLYASFNASMAQILALNNGENRQALPEDSDSIFATFTILAEAERLISAGDKTKAIEILEKVKFPIGSTPQLLFLELVEAVKSEL